MNRIIVLLFTIIFISGCSIHQMVNGDKKPGLAYASIDKNGIVVSNNKGSSNLFDLADNYFEGKTNDEIRKILDSDFNRSTLFVWSAEYNGAMVNGKGDTCLQAATYAKTTNTTVDISSSLLKAFTKIDISSSSSGEDKLLAMSITQAISKLSESTAQSTYLAAGLFGLCVIQANEKNLEPEQLEGAITELIKASTLTPELDVKNEHNRVAGGL